MCAAWLERQALRVVADAPIPRPAPGEALVRVALAGICGTDLELLRGYYPYAGIPGHEFVGRVEAAPGAEGWTGRRVVGEINAACHACDDCRAGRATHCERRSVLGIRARHGAFAHYLMLPVENLHEVPPEVPDATAVFVEPLAAALEIQQQVKIQRGQRVVVVGDGRLGQLVAQTMALTGCELRVVGRHEAKLSRLASLGIRGSALEVPERSFDVAVECTGDPSGFELARRALRPRGTLVLKSTYAGALKLNASSLVVDEITLVGSRCGPFGLALELLAGGRVDVAGLVHARYPIAEAVAAFDHAARPGVLKVLIDCDA
jgi:2-desacetyl-2-hydroxyethyl bacteriochlorophyllide A dehydrogenase